jgi:hypothetical protein
MPVRLPAPSYEYEVVVTEPGEFADAIALRFSGLFGTCRGYPEVALPRRSIRTTNQQYSDHFRPKALARAVHLA